MKPIFKEMTNNALGKNEGGGGSRWGGSFVLRALGFWPSFVEAYNFHIKNLHIV